ncbi:MAG: tRNA G18 (ribose-2'-O)-methylase SpoU [Chloroflexi bacterium AL-W]|nr:tRNA G18 (ribose-2'-O)-methylase SpoU [Chloroflexi bacterium AL-N1]NOK69537.1 tRNA G18 (ribose-2'-O)-methylase SpoU [Chloroflexi bacterium AL-N10]NOK77502.1 tRNA G18 (ribose-2'-O)-methylase SpoU [Chloroflexi bacterium AL-N5]NOK84353.1 tRNA G18 (ribose-2'-O)-methylase SpoU [Chloroflexi bacterium AL-W]NOK91481.1 tRNA G18 (ribose-2'-O)-methylase SpoU [Chloroflexi bacterium AL-N15]
MIPISSPHNPRIKQIRALRHRKERDRTGCFFVEGLHAVAEALHLQAPVETLVVAPDLINSSYGYELVEKACQSSAPCLTVTKEVFASLVPRDATQGIAAVVQQRWGKLTYLNPPPAHCWVALESVQYPGNLGTILRTSDAAGGTGLMLIGNTTDPYDPASVRASVGTIFAQQLIRTNIAAFTNWIQHHDVCVIGTSPAATLDYRAIPYPKPLVVLMGSERAGLSPAMQDLCYAIVHIPMVGRSDSLNLAVATSLLLYEVFRQQ